MKGYRNLRLIGLALLVFLGVGTTGFHVIEGWSWFDGFYMTLTTFTTIGYQETHPLSPSGRVFNVFLIISGVSLVFLGIGTLTQALVEFELRDLFGRRRMEREIERLSGHYIICGAGRVGRSVAKELNRKSVPFVVVDTNEAKIAKYVAEGWLTLIGDGTQETTLRKVQVQKAAGLVAATTTDATNIYIVLTARGLNPKLKIIARASEEDAEKHLKTAGADSVISPYHFAGHRIAQAFLRPHVLDFLDSATVHLGMDLEIAQIAIAAGSRFVGQSLAESHIRHDMGVIVLAIKRGDEMRVGPSRDDLMEAGDVLIAMGDPSGLRRLEETAHDESARTSRR
ncbi:MAG TPA: potassium channel protein [Terriglobales bacterium]|nr:potassium channel protein [Terriglobales bacterium]